MWDALYKTWPADKGGSADGLGVIAPPFWMTQKETLRDKTGGTSVRFTLGVPGASSVREGDVNVTLGGPEGVTRGELYYRCRFSE